MYQEKLEDFKQQLQHLNSGMKLHISYFIPFFMSLALVKKVEFQSTGYVM